MLIVVGYTRSLSFLLGDAGALVLRLSLNFTFLECALLFFRVLGRALFFLCHKAKKIKSET